MSPPSQRYIFLHYSAGRGVGNKTGTFGQDLSLVDPLFPNHTLPYISVMGVVSFTQVFTIHDVLIFFSKWIFQVPCVTRIYLNIRILGTEE